MRNVNPSIRSSLSTSSEQNLDKFIYVSQTIDDGDDEDGAIQPVIYEDNDDSDEEGSEVTMETESIPDVEEPEAFSDISDHEGSDGMSG